MSTNKIILFADDDSDFLESVQYMLMDEGYDVTTATNGEEAITKFKEIKPDVMFLDIKMPVLDGYETFFRIKKYDPDAKIIFTSSYALDDEKYKKAKQCSLTDLLNKPFEFEDLEKIIKKHS